MSERLLGTDSPRLATALDNLALLYWAQHRYQEAEPLLRRLLAIQEKSLGPDHPDVAESLNHLAQVYRSQGRYAEAEPLLKRALAIQQKAPDSTRP
jgi:tetratricopeptide (TPR) repeat protein